MKKSQVTFPYVKNDPVYIFYRETEAICVWTQYTHIHTDVNACFEMLAMLWKTIQKILICDFLGGKKRRKKDSDLKKSKESTMFEYL